MTTAKLSSGGGGGGARYHHHHHHHHHHQQQYHNNQQFFVPSSWYRISQSVLLGLAICVVLLQVRVFFHASSSTSTTSTPLQLLPKITAATNLEIPGRETTRIRRNDDGQDPKRIRPSSSSFEKENTSSKSNSHSKRSPKVLIGIMSGTHNSIQRTYRNRHRQLFQLWNDTRLCAFGDYVNSFAENNDNNDADDRFYNCEVLYTFVVGAYSSTTGDTTAKTTTTITTTRKQHSRDIHLPTVIVDETTIDEHSFECSTVEHSQIRKQQSGLGRIMQSGTSTGPGTATTDQQHHHHWPLTLPKMPTYVAHINDIVATPSQVTILNIQENMNEGKTPTFLYWAHKMSVKYRIPYVAKCDSDSVMRWPSLLNFIDKQLPMTATAVAASPPLPPDPQPPSPPPKLPYAVMGFIRSKATWDEVADETIWKREFSTGLHLYLGGSFFLMSSDLAGAAATEVRDRLVDYYHALAKKRCKDLESNNNHVTDINTPFTFKNLSYFEGHEDHDALSAAQAAATRQHRTIRWILPLKMQHFWEHPVKGQTRWNRIWNRELKRRDATPEVAQSMFHWTEEALAKPTPSSVSILVVLGATTKESRQRFRADLQSQSNNDNPICKLSLIQHTVLDPQKCSLYYFFALGKDSESDSSPNRILDHTKENIVDDDVMKVSTEEDVLFLNIKQNVHAGMGESVMNWLSVTERLSLDGPIRTDMILFCQASFRFDATKWKILKDDHDSFLSPSTVVPKQPEIVASPFFIVGDIHDRRQRPYEFPKSLSSNPTEQSAMFSRDLEAIHLYASSDCFAVSANLVSFILEQARKKIEDNGVLFVGDLGHDLTSFAHLASEQYNRSIVLQWVLISRERMFWESFETYNNNIDSDVSSQRTPISAAKGDKNRSDSGDVEMYSCSYGEGENLTTIQFPEVTKPPSFIMIGVQKSGTTSILSYLRDYHPNVLQTTKALRREAHFFDTAWQGILKRCANMGLVQAKDKLCVAMGDYMKLFHIPKLIEAAKDPNVTNHLYTFEKTPSYFCNPRIPLRIKQLVPWSKVILILRNPVDRLYSHYKMTVKDVFSLRSKTLEDFLYHEVQAMREFQMTTAPLPSINTSTSDHPEVPWDHPLPEKNWKPKMAINSYTSDPELGHQILLRRGLYGTQLKWWLKHFTPNKDIMIINYRDMLEDTKSVLFQILNFVGIPIITTGNSSVTYGKVRADNRKAERPMSNSTRRYLQQFYAPYNAELEELLGPEWSTDKLGW